MKYWRYRMYLLPKDDPFMKRIQDENLEHCDIYTGETTVADQKQKIEEFLRLVEMHLNKIKRIKKPRVSCKCSIFKLFYNLCKKNFKKGKIKLVWIKCKFCRLAG